MGKLARHKDASFTNPTTGEKEWAKVLDEIWTVQPEDLPEICPGHDDGWLETVFVAQLIGPPNGVRQIRICYWTRRPGLGPDGWVFAQFAPVMGLQECRHIFDGIRERGWLEPPRAGTAPAG